MRIIVNYLLRNGTGRKGKVAAWRDVTGRFGAGVAKGWARHRGKTRRAGHGVGRNVSGQSRGVAEFFYGEDGNQAAGSGSRQASPHTAR